MTHFPLNERHAFVTIPEPTKGEFSLIIPRAGDWAANTIDNPPTKLWVRGLPAYGVLGIAPMLRRVILVATGSSIDPCVNASLKGVFPYSCSGPHLTPGRLLATNFSTRFFHYAPDTILYDTRKHGEPDLVKLALKMANGFYTEAVGVIFNQQLTEKLMYGLTSRGIPAYGAIFGSSNNAPPPIMTHDREASLIPYHSPTVS